MSPHDYFYHASAFHIKFLTFLEADKRNISDVFASQMLFPNRGHYPMHIHLAAFFDVAHATELYMKSYLSIILIEQDVFSGDIRGDNMSTMEMIDNELRDCNHSIKSLLSKLNQYDKDFFKNSSKPSNIILEWLSTYCSSIESRYKLPFDKPFKASALKCVPFLNELRQTIYKELHKSNRRSFLSMVRNDRNENGEYTIRLKSAGD